MKIPFTKMHGAGNDFIVVDDRNHSFPLEDCAFIRRITARRTGIGSDGIILVQPSASADLRMRFLNPDGNEVEMCGNGARCFARFAFDSAIVPARMTVETVAGILRAEVLEEDVTLELTDPSGFEPGLELGLDWITDTINTGVPHAVSWVDDVAGLDVLQWGRTIRFHERFAPAGINVNFARLEADGTLTVRTYERGVEDETLACGTGAAAVAVIAARRGRVALPVTVHCAGGFDLVINESDGRTTLTGSAAKVFDGEIEYGNRV